VADFDSLDSFILSIKRRADDMNDEIHAAKKYLIRSLHNGNRPTKNKNKRINNQKRKSTKSAS